MEQKIKNNIWLRIAGMITLTIFTGFTIYYKMILATILWVLCFGMLIYETFWYVRDQNKIV